MIRRKCEFRFIKKEGWPSPLLKVGNDHFYKSGRLKLFNQHHLSSHLLAARFKHVKI